MKPAGAATKAGFSSEPWWRCAALIGCMSLTPRKGGTIDSELSCRRHSESRCRQCATIGELHHALEEGPVTTADVHAELAEVISGRKPGHTAAEKIIILDSSGRALQDVAAGAVVYEKAARERGGTTLNFAS